MEISCLMNKDQVNDLFKKEAILIGTQDAVPNRRVIALFGRKAYVNALRMETTVCICKGDEVGLFGLNLYGFQIAASWNNARLFQKEAPNNE